jgi:hypothetical protein
LVLFLAQNKALMEKLGPALSFVEEHKDSLDLFKDLLEQSRTPTLQPTQHPIQPQPPQQQSTQPTPPEKPQKEERSPLQGIASDEILKEIQTYLSAQNRSMQ